MILMGPFQLTMFYDSVLKDVNLCCAAPQRYFKIETGKRNPLPCQTESSGRVCQCVKPYTLKVRQTTASYHPGFLEHSAAGSFSKEAAPLTLPSSCGRRRRSQSILTISQIFQAVLGGSRRTPRWHMLLPARRCPRV